MLKSFQDEQMLHQMVTSEEEERCSQVQASKLDTSFMSSVRTSASHVNTSFMRMGSVVSLSQHRASGSERRSTEDPERLRRKRYVACMMDPGRRSLEINDFSLYPVYLTRFCNMI